MAKVGIRRWFPGPLGLYVIITMQMQLETSADYRDGRNTLLHVTDQSSLSINVLATMPARSRVEVPRVPQEFGKPRRPVPQRAACRTMRVPSSGGFRVSLAAMSADSVHSHVASLPPCAGAMEESHVGLRAYTVSPPSLYFGTPATRRSTRLILREWVTGRESREDSISCRFLRCS